MPDMQEDHAASQLVPGFLVGGGRFALVQQIGAGGMGTIWLAQDERLNERVALKFLSAAFRDDALANLRKETQKSRKLTHPNIIRIHDLYEAPDELAFISMEFVDGIDLAQLKAKQPHCIFTWEFLQPIVKQLCKALEYAHAEGVVHRDLKPSNMILDAKGRLKLADFGLAALMHEPYSSAQPKGSWAGGTINYMSPQQLYGFPAGVSDDIYALGATLYELLTSRTPFYVGDIAEQTRTVAAIPITDRLEEFELKNEIPRDVRAMIMACLSKDPDTRPQSARAVAEWMGLTAISAPQKPTPPEPTPAPPVIEEPAEVVEAAPRRGSRRVAAAIVTVALV
ncbi:MAG: serine/threonine-protein kinase, partial [Limisphaerales bacterium]